MHIHFWGVRGSLPVPLVSSHIQDKVAAIIDQIHPADVESPEAKQRFLAELPPWLESTVGGNTSCVSVTLDDPRQVIIFDAGSGIRELGIALAQREPNIPHYHIFFSHFHWDHIMGLPFFNPAYDPTVQVDFYSPKQDLENILSRQMLSPYFPITMDMMGATKGFHALTAELPVYSVHIAHKLLNHPGDSYAYRIDDGKHRFIYATDVALSAADFIENEENTTFFEHCDLAVVDSQYTLKEAIEKYNWGHSAFSMAVDFAAHWKIKHLVLFHHEPTYDDRKLYSLLQSAQWYIERMGFKGLTVSLATEGLEISL
ncbi:MAG: MBL fold metallo-hydrolase [Spirochaetaceae bacterium]|jgi:phosphoribosyl 1,2-cyclic phosphodiesterase|nr:MBL fold metallo-hydrolase [Spirochaetaceae bacterium]